MADNKKQGGRRFKETPYRCAPDVPGPGIRGQTSVSNGCDQALYCEEDRVDGKRCFRKGENRRVKENPAIRVSGESPLNILRNLKIRFSLTEATADCYGPITGAPHGKDASTNNIKDMEKFLEAFVTSYIKPDGTKEKPWPVTPGAACQFQYLENLGGNKGYMVGNKLSLADVAVYELLDVSYARSFIKKLMPEFEQRFPKLVAAFKKVRDLEGMKKFNKCL